jgi:hypothetical protein
MAFDYAKTFPFGGNTFSNLSGGVTDIFGGSATAAGLRLKAQGSLVEAGNYDLAAGLAKQNEKFTEQSTAVKQLMADRQIQQVTGSETADIAGAGFDTGSGSALDLLRSSAQQGALQKQLVGQQGLITEAGYTEQATAYSNLAGYARMAADTENKMAGTSGFMGAITGGIKIALGLASVATLFTGSATPAADQFAASGMTMPTDL